MDYVAGMNFLGNDFVPHGISLKIREGGHDQLLDNLKDLHSSGKRLAKQEGGIWTYHFDGVCFLAKLWAEAEEKKLLEFIKNKHHKINYEDSQMLPCQWAEENKVLCEERGKLYTDWETRMVSEWFGQGVTMRQVCDAYANSLQWILDYYTAQRETDMTWIYPWSLPPSWNGWLRYCIERPNSFTDFKCQQTTIIQPQEQLAMVLPLESWHFLRDAKLTRLPELFPQFWPSKFGFFSAGKIFMWECEAELPLLHLPVVRSVS